MKVQYKRDILEIKKAFNLSGDIVQLEFTIGEKSVSVFYIDGFNDKRVLEDYILNPLKNLKEISFPYYDILNEVTIMTTPIQTLKTIDTAVMRISEGEIIVVIEGGEGYFMYSEKELPKRSITEPPVNNVLRGPREGFSEDVKTNMILIRKRLYSSNLKIEIQTVGRFSRTKVAILYLDKVADLNIVKKIKNKISQIDIDGIIESSYIARFLEENKHSLFSQVGTSEKPDVIAAKMLEGRVAIIVDGSPSVLTLPFILFEHFQTAEDYYIKSFSASLIRVVRLIAAILAVILPGLYVSFLEFQYQMLPLKFLNAIIQATSKIPLTPTLEMMVVLVLFEILREASVRMPRYVGMALSVVGAIVLGDTAVSAGLLSSPTILVIAISTIGIYCVPDEVYTISVLRVVFVVMGGILGIFGIILASMAIVAYLASLINYGSSYLAPYAPALIHDWQDGVIKEELYSLKERPYSISTKNRTRQKKS